MFILTTLVYPAALAVLCLGSGLLVDRVSGRFLPAVLLATVGAAALIAVSNTPIAGKLEVEIVLMSFVCTAKVIASSTIQPNTAE